MKIIDGRTYNDDGLMALFEQFDNNQTLFLEFARQGFKNI